MSSRTSGNRAERGWSRAASSSVPGERRQSCARLASGSAAAGTRLSPRQAAAAKCLNRRHLRRYALCECRNRRWLREPHGGYTSASPGHHQGAQRHTVPTAGARSAGTEKNRLSQSRCLSSWHARSVCSTSHSTENSGEPRIKAEVSPSCQPKLAGVPVARASRISSCYSGICSFPSESRLW